LYDSFKEQGLPVELIGIGTETYISGLDNWTNNNNAPVVSDESPFSTWTSWGASQRDLFVLDQSGNVVLEQNITSGLPDNLQELITDLLDPSVSPCVLGTVFVSEVNNSGTTGNFIEIYNSGDIDCLLEGFRLGNSDDPLNYSFGNIVLPAGDFWLGYEGQDSSFTSEINATADTIILSDSNGNLLSINIDMFQELDGVALSQSFSSEGIGCYTNPSPSSTNNACLVLSNEEQNFLPEQVTLYQNYPNPFNPSTTIRFFLENDAEASLTIYDANGKLISNLFKGFQIAGTKSYSWNGTNQSGQKVTTGVYIYSLDVNGVAYNKKMIFIK
tara:strand:+ start:1094 stop:2080 length:987 start_codon:yes stop_codon:yes gene_type:complete